MHCSCVEQHEAFMADLKYKLKNIEEELQTANKCESNAWCNQYVIFEILLCSVVYEGTTHIITAITRTQKGD